MLQTKTCDPPKKIQNGRQKSKMAAMKLGQVTLSSKLLTQRTKVVEQVKIHIHNKFCSLGLRLLPSIL